MLNRVTLIGNLGDDPQMNTTKAGGAVANISIATSMRWKDKESGEKKEATEWHRVVAFNRLAEIMQEYLKKGMQVYIEGRIQTRKWQDADGNDRWSTEIIAERMNMLGVKREGGDSGGAKAEQQAQAQQNTPPDYNDFNDDVPF